jgi:hypothetical protein
MSYPPDAFDIEDQERLMKTLPPGGEDSDGIAAFPPAAVKAAELPGDPRVTLTHTIKLKELPHLLLKLWSLPIDELGKMLDYMKLQTFQNGGVVTTGTVAAWLHAVDIIRKNLFDIDASLSEIQNILSSYREFLSSAEKGDEVVK